MEARIASIETGPAVGDPFVEPGGPQGAQYAAASAALNGFDMVVAVSEATLNFQLAHLFKHKLLPQAASSEDPRPSIKLTFGPPTVDLQMATSRFDQDGRSAVLRMHVTTGVHESCATSPSGPDHARRHHTGLLRAARDRRRQPRHDPADAGRGRRERGR